ncbi:MAG: hypothetical protein GXO36_00515 [Chloroflexi bacterium]|nr:hypothetical protein [Chloroflexota bacterium]
MGRKLLVVLSSLLWGLLATGCQAAIPRASTPTPTPTPAPRVTVEREPSLAAWDEPLARCASEGPILLTVRETLTEAPQPNADETVWRLIWGEPPPHGQAFALGTETAHPVLGPHSPEVPPEEGLTLEEWRALWTGQVTRWSELRPTWPDIPIRPLAPWPNSALGQGLTALVGPRWRYHPQARLAPDPELAIELLLITQGSVGWLPHGWLAWRRAQGDPRLLRVRELQHPEWTAAVVLWYGSEAELAQPVLRWISCLQHTSGDAYVPHSRPQVHVPAQPDLGPQRLAQRLGLPGVA